MAVAVAGAAGVSASAATAAAPSWHLVKQVHSGGRPNFSAIVAVGKTGGWAFNQGNTPTAWRRSGSTWTKTSSFPGKKNDFVAVAKASSATNVWAFIDGSNEKSRALRWNGRVWKNEGSFAKEIAGAVVLSRDDVWIFGQQAGPESALGSWHFNGRNWTHVKSGIGLSGGSGLSAKNVWAFSRTDVAHWNGRTWTRTSVQALLPAKTKDNNPCLFSMYASSPRSVWAVANGLTQPNNGPIVLLHFNGRRWNRVALTDKFGGGADQGQIAPDGHGGVWIPVSDGGDGKSFIAHYSGGQLTAAKLPVAGNKIDVTSIAAIPGTTGALAGGFTLPALTPQNKNLSAILQFKS